MFDGVINGCAWTRGSLRFSAASDMVVTSNYLPEPTYTRDMQLTVMAWVLWNGVTFPTATPSGASTPTIVGKPSGRLCRYTMSIAISLIRHIFAFCLRTPAIAPYNTTAVVNDTSMLAVVLVNGYPAVDFGGVRLVGATALSPYRWYHVAVTKVKNAKKLTSTTLYIDGVPTTLTVSTARCCCASSVAAVHFTDLYAIFVPVRLTTTAVCPTWTTGRHRSRRRCR